MQPDYNRWSKLYQRRKYGASNTCMGDGIGTVTWVSIEFRHGDLGLELVVACETYIWYRYLHIGLHVGRYRNLNVTSRNGD